MVLFLQPKSLINVPSFNELVNIYGPFLGLILFLVILFIVGQYYWFNRLARAKDKEIARLVAHEKELNDRLYQIIDDTLGLKPGKSRNR